MRRWIASILLAAALGACDQPQPAAAPDAATAQAAAPTVPRYVGLWAVDQRMCADPPWRFEPRGISTQGEVSCDFTAVRDEPGGYDVQAMCSAESPPEPYEIHLRFAESAHAMLIEGGPWSAGIGLVYCSPLD